MSLTGKWRIVTLPDFPADYPDLAEPAYILFQGDGAKRLTPPPPSRTTARDAAALPRTRRHVRRRDEAL